jgi:hypothetical protein
MTICVKEPESGEELQLAVKLIDLKHRTEWLVTLPKGDALVFKFTDGTWTTNQDKQINDEFAEAIGHIIGLLSIHQQAGQDLDKFFRSPLVGSVKAYPRKY